MPLHWKCSIRFLNDLIFCPRLLPISAFRERNSAEIGVVCSYWLASKILQFDRWTSKVFDSLIIYFLTIFIFSSRRLTKKLRGREQGAGGASPAPEPRRAERNMGYERDRGTAYYVAISQDARKVNETSTIADNIGNL